MEIFKNFIVGCAVMLIASVLLIIVAFLLPFLLVAGSIILLSLRFVLFIAVCLGLILLVGYLVRKGFRKNNGKPMEEDLPDKVLKKD